MIKRVLGAAAVTTAAALAFASPAYAGTDGYADTRPMQGPNGSIPTGSGSVIFEHYGEHFTLYDNKADGLGVVVYWKVSGVSQPKMYWGGGAGTSHDFDKDIAEGRSVWFRVCLIDGGASGELYTPSCEETGATS